MNHDTGKMPQQDAADMKSIRIQSSNTLTGGSRYDGAARKARASWILPDTAFEKVQKSVDTTVSGGSIFGADLDQFYTPLNTDAQAFSQLRLRQMFQLPAHSDVFTYQHS